MIEYICYDCEEALRALTDGRYQERGDLEPRYCMMYIDGHSYDECGLCGEELPSDSDSISTYSVIFGEIQ